MVARWRPSKNLHAPGLPSMPSPKFKSHFLGRELTNRGVLEECSVWNSIFPYTHTELFCSCLTFFHYLCPSAHHSVDAALSRFAGMSHNTYLLNFPIELAPHQRKTSKNMLRLELRFRRRLQTIGNMGPC